MGSVKINIIKINIIKIREKGIRVKNIFFNIFFAKRIGMRQKKIDDTNTNVNAQNIYNRNRDYFVRYQSHIDHLWSCWDNVMK